MLDVNQQPSTALNIAFSQRGLNAMGVSDPLGDSAFSSGQAADANTLGDPGTRKWVPAFTSGLVDGLFMLTSDAKANIDSEIVNIKSMLNGSAAEIYRLDGMARPGDQEGHERT